MLLLGGAGMTLGIIRPGEEFFLARAAHGWPGEAKTLGGTDMAYTQAERSLTGKRGLPRRSVQVKTCLLRATASRLDAA